MAATRVRFFALLGASLMLGACSLLVDLADLSPGSQQDGGGDVTVDVDDGGGDGATDSASDASAESSTRFCDSIDADFCEDFDELDGGYVGRWSGININVGNSLATTAAQQTSLPNAMVATVPATSSGGAALWHNLPAGASLISYSFDVRFEPYDAGSGGVLFSQVEIDSFDASSAYTEYRFETLATTTHFQAHVFYADGGSTVADMQLPVTFDASHWYHIDEELTVASPAKVTILVDGNPVVATTIAGATNGPGPCELLAGIYHTVTPTGGWTMYFDDIVVRTK